MRALAVVIAIALVPVSTAVGDTPEDAALAHLDRGIEAFDAKDFQRAHGEFTAAHQLVPDKANPYRWLALTEIQLGNCESALLRIDGFLSRVPPADARVPEMQRWREHCRRELAKPEPQVTGTQGLGEPRDTPTPITRRWWFWPTLGVAALAITGAVIYVATDQHDTVLPSIRCDDAGCQ
jgi:hypothetical protein